MEHLLALFGLTVGCAVAGGVAIVVTRGVRELLCTVGELAALTIVVILIGLALLVASGAIGV